MDDLGTFDTEALVTLGSDGAAAADPLYASYTGAQVDAAMSRVEFSTALEAITRVVTQANRYIEVTAPWKLAKQADHAARLQMVLHVLAEIIRIISITLEPFMPSVAEAMWRQLGCGTTPRRLADASRWPGLNAGQPIGPHPILFPRGAGA